MGRWQRPQRPVLRLSPPTGAGSLSWPVRFARMEDGTPQAVGAITADGDLRVPVVIDDGLLESTDGGATFTTLLSR